MKMQQWHGNLFADYFQFYLWDSQVDPVAPTDWSEEDIKRRLKAEMNVVVVCPIRNMTVPVTVEVHSSAPPLNDSEWDHVAECSLELPTGHLEVHECTGGSVATFNVTPGAYRVRALYAGLGTLDETGLEGNDTYLVALWPDSYRELVVIKQWSEDHEG